MREKSDREIDGKSNLRFRKIYLRDLNDENYDDLNLDEITELKKRKALQEWCKIKPDEVVEELVISVFKKNIMKKFSTNIAKGSTKEIK